MKFSANGKAIYAYSRVWTWTDHVQPSGDHISSIHRSRLYGVCVARTVISTLYIAQLAINLPVSRPGFKAHANNRWCLMGYQRRMEYRRAHSRIHRLKEKIISPVRTHHRRFVDGWENSNPLRGILKPVIRRRGYNGIYGSNWIFVHRDQHRARRLNSSIINGYTRFFNRVIFIYVGIYRQRKFWFFKRLKVCDYLRIKRIPFVRDKLNYNAERIFIAIYYDIYKVFDTI